MARATVTVGIGTEVVFIDRFRRVHEGTVTQIDRIGGKPSSAHVNVPAEGYGFVIPWSKIAVKGTPRADSLLKAQQPLVPGVVVQVILPPGKSYGGLANGDYGVVLADKGEQVNVAKLGGHNGTYARLTRSTFAVVTVPPKVVITGAVTQAA